MHEGFVVKLIEDTPLTYTHLKTRANFDAFERVFIV